MISFYICIPETGLLIIGGQKILGLNSNIATIMWIKSIHYVFIDRQGRSSVSNRW